MALPGRGSSLVAGAQTATLARDEVERLVLDGFFPACDARARPYRTQAGLRDWGLPYAADSAVTHHLADFLRDRPRVDAVLFNGGSLHSAVLRQRLLEQIAAWQGGTRPTRTGQCRTRSRCRTRRRTLRQAAARPLRSHRGRRCPRGVPPGADGVGSDEPGGLRLLWSACCRATRQRSKCSTSICRALRCAPTSGELSGLFLDPSWPLPRGRCPAVGRGSVSRAAASADDHQNGRMGLTPGRTGPCPSVWQRK